nr:YfbM family protein [Streptomyces sp. NBC_00830]
MSFSMQARSVPAAGLPRDFDGVAAVFADTDGELDRLETDLGISKDFSEVHELFLTAPPGHGSCELPVFGGNVHEDPAGIEAPSVTLEAPEVREAAEFLRTHPFDELWRAADGGVGAHWGWPEAEVRAVFAAHYRQVLDFYGLAAEAGDAVVKRFLY